MVLLKIVRVRVMLWPDQELRVVLLGFRPQTRYRIVPEGFRVLWIGVGLLGVLVLLLGRLGGVVIVIVAGAGIACLGARGGGVLVVAIAVAVVLLLEVFRRLDGFPMHSWNVVGLLTDSTFQTITIHCLLSLSFLIINFYDCVLITSKYLLAFPVWNVITW